MLTHLPRRLPSPVVAVTGLNATDNPGPGVAVIRALRADPSFRGSIVGLARDVLDPGLYLPGLVDASFLVPWPTDGRAALVARLAVVQAQVGLDVLLPTLDAELPALVTATHELAALGIASFLPTPSQLEAREKVRLADLGQRLGLPVPRSGVVQDVEGLLALCARLGPRCVVKGPMYGARVCASVDEAVVAFYATVATWGLPVVVQEAVGGEEVDVCGVGDGQGGLVGAVPMRKLWMTAAGKGWAGVAIRDASVLALAQRFVAGTHWRGPFELELRREASGALHVLEINPRFPAWCDLTASAGQNLPASVVTLAQGLPLAPLSDYRPGAAFVRASVDCLVDISELESLTMQGERVPRGNKGWSNG